MINRSQLIAAEGSSDLGTALYFGGIFHACKAPLYTYTFLLSGVTIDESSRIF